MFSNRVRRVARCPSDRQDPNIDSKGASQHSFLAVYGILPGHVVVVGPSADAPARVVFKTGIALGNKPRRELVSVPISQIRAVRKTNGIAAVGLSATLGITGVGEGLEIDDADGKVRRRASCWLIGVDDLVSPLRSTQCAVPSHPRLR